MLTSTETTAESLPIADGGILEINLSAIVRNWRALSAPLKAGCRASAVVKANAYGLGCMPVSKALYEAGCRDFFVALLGEALELKPALPDDARIYVLDGLRAGTEIVCREQGIIPVIFSLKQLSAWSTLESASGLSPCVIKVNTGMTRLGFDAKELLDNEALLSKVKPVMFMSHLASAEELDNNQNRRQLERFQALRDHFSPLFPAADFSLCNSSGVFLGDEYHFDCTRPGAALYGVNPQPGLPSPVESVVRLRLPVIQLRNAQAGEVVGYGGTHELKEGAQLAVVLGGYADGIHRALSGRAEGVVHGQRVPVVGRVSMDTTVFDVSKVSPPVVEGESYVELLGSEIGVDELGEAAGTIGYEILTSLSGRYQRHYIQS